MLRINLKLYFNWLSVSLLTILIHYVLNNIFYNVIYIYKLENQKHSNKVLFLNIYFYR